VLTGQGWLNEILNLPIWIHEQLGVTWHVFQKLTHELQDLHGLCDSKYISADEQLAIFLHFARVGASSCMLQECFQRSGDTISKYVPLITIYSITYIV
jgi:hypothetical protein